MPEPLRVAVVTPRFPPDPGGAEAYAGWMARTLREEPGIEVLVVSTRPGGQERRETWEGIPVLRLPTALTISNTPVHPGWYPRLRRLFREERVDVVATHAPVPGLADVATLAAGSRPVVATYHSGSMVKGAGGAVDRLLRGYERLVLPRVLRRAERVVAVSPVALTRGARHTALITPGVDTSVFTPPVPGTRRSRTVLYVGRMERTSAWKGVDVLVEAFARLGPELADTTLTLVGGGDWLPELRRRAAELGVADRLVLPGPLPPERVAEHYRSAAVTVLPSLSESESFGMTLVEAMACGSPVVGSRVGGIPFVLREGQDGLLATPGDAGDLAARLREVLGDDELAARRGADGVRVARERWDWRHQRERMVGEIHAAVSAHSPGAAERSSPGRRVLHVAHYAHPHIGGLETVVAAQTTGLVRRGWEVGLLTSAWRRPGGVREEEGVRVIRVPAWHGFEEHWGAPFPVFGPGLLPAAWDGVRRAELVHVHDPLYLSSWAAALCCRLLRRPYVVHRHVGFVHHSSPVVRLVQWVVLRTVARFVLRGAAAVLCIDERIAEGVRAAVPHPERVRVLGNGVDTELFRPAYDAAERAATRASYGLPEGTPLVMFAGRFVPKKGFREVAAAADDAYGLVLVGGERPSGLDDERLYFPGSLEAAEMARLYRAVDAFVVASVGECPLTVLEAQASGLPLLVNDDEALRTGWTEGPGVRVVDVRGGHLREELRALVADLPDRTAAGRRGREFIADRYSWAAHVETLAEVYARVLSEEGAR